MKVPWYHRWLLNLPKKYWPEWLKRKTKTETIEIKLWHRDRHIAAQVLREYAEIAFRDAWGDTYDIQATVRSRSIPEMSDDETFGYVRDHQEAVKDVNAICLGHTDAVGGGSTCRFSVDSPFEDVPDVADLWVKPNRGLDPMPVEEYACHEPYDLISTALHEMGHCVGLGHNVGGEITHKGKRYVTPMPYSNLDCYYLRFSEESKTRTIDVQ